MATGYGVEQETQFEIATEIVTLTPPIGLALEWRLFPLRRASASAVSSCGLADQILVPTW